MRPFASIPPLAAAAALAHALPAGSAHACAPAMRPGDHVRIVAEEALIVWEAERGVEHFIRRGDFETDAEDFGFLVPTPTEPELAEADGAVFDRLETLMAPEVTYESSWFPVTCCTGLLFLTAGAERGVEVAATAPAVRVLNAVRVGAYDAVVLEADSAAALSAWLDEHGYATRPALAAWLEPYVAARWKITAFKYARDSEGSPVLGSPSVRMTFRTDRPFYPYREPVDHDPPADRSLRVAMISDVRMAGAVEGADAAWGAEVEWAGRIEAPAALLGDAAPMGQTAGGRWLTSFVDRASRRAPGDLFFAPSEDRSEVVPEPVVIQSGETLLPIPVEPIALGAGLWWWFRRRRRQRAQKSAQPPGG